MLPMYSILTFKTMMLMTIWILPLVMFLLFLCYYTFFGARLSADQNNAVPFEYFLIFIFFLYPFLYVDINPMS